MQLTWLTDTHLNQWSFQRRHEFYAKLKESAPQALLHTGDIAEAEQTPQVLLELLDACQCPIYFVLGNHDYYGASADSIRQRIKRLCKAQPKLIWLAEHNFFALSSTTALIGQDGWPDARAGDFMGSDYHHHDVAHIPALQACGEDKEQRQKVMQQWADNDATQCAKQLSACVDAGYRRLIVATHVPPFVEASRYHGKVNQQSELPFFTNVVLGQLLMAFARQNPMCQLDIYCGHTHSACAVKILANCHVFVGGARPLKPTMIEIID